jgi:tyrosyl-tRNA synthetase
MMQKESVRERLNNREQGISYTEFSYMILQAYDFSYLHEHDGITVQFGGSDQYGNIVAGSDLIRRIAAMNDDEPSKTFGLTAPLVQKADGGKFGKTETGAVWLTAARTSPYAYYQFWLNATDEDAKNWIKVFTFLPQDEIESLIARHDENPGARELQRTLAQNATQILHGTDAMENAEAAGKALFSGEVGTLDQETLVEVFASVPTTEHAKSDLGGEGVDPVELLIECNLASSKREAREFLSGNSVSINGEKIDGDTRINASHLLHGSFIAIRRGKKNWHMTKWA